MGLLVLDPHRLFAYWETRRRSPISLKLSRNDGTCVMEREFGPSGSCYVAGLEATGSYRAELRSKGETLAESATVTLPPAGPDEFREIVEEEEAAAVESAADAEGPAGVAELPAIAEQVFSAMAKHDASASIDRPTSPPTLETSWEGAIVVVVNPSGDAAGEFVGPPPSSAHLGSGRE